MSGFHLLSVLCTSSQASTIKRLTAYLPISIIRRRYNQGKKESNIGHDDELERAPSTAEEFKRVAEEKSRQGLASQTVDKAQDAAREAASGDSTFESVEEAHKGNLHKTGDE